MKRLASYVIPSSKSAGLQEEAAFTKKIMSPASRTILTKLTENVPRTTQIFASAGSYRNRCRPANLSGFSGICSALCHSPASDDSSSFSNSARKSGQHPGFWPL